LTELLSAATEERMLQAYRDQASSVIEDAGSYQSEAYQRHFGVEFECSLLRSNTQPVHDQVLRDEVIGDGDNNRYVVELGAGQIEVCSPIIDLIETPGFEPILTILDSSVKDLRRRSAVAGGRIVLSGTNPLVPFNSIARTNKEKYQLVPDYYNSAQNGNSKRIGPNGLWVGEASLVSILNSIQPNFEAISLKDAVDKTNRLLMISPMAVALTANGRYLDLKDSGMADLRITAWRTAHDARTAEQIAAGIEPRVGLPNQYYSGIEDYFERITQHPFLLNHPEDALDIGIGMNWKDAKIKFKNQKAVVEFRAMSTQPTPEASAAALLFVAGRLFYSQQTNENLLPMRLVHQNAHQAAHFGLDGKLWLQSRGGLIKLPAKQAIATELNRAHQGLKLAEIPNLEWAYECLQEMRRNLIDGTPSDRMKTIVEKSRGSMHERLLNGLVKVGALVV
jgi:hypothetical protein